MLKFATFALLVLTGCSDRESPPPLPPSQFSTTVIKCPSPVSANVDARVDTELASGLADARLAGQNATHVYLALAHDDQTTQIVRVAKAGGPVEDLATLDFEVKDLVVEPDGILVAGADPSVDHRRGVIGTLDDHVPATFHSIVDGPKPVFRVVRVGGTIFTIAAAADKARHRLYRVGSRGLELVPIKHGPSSVDLFALAGDADHVYVVDADERDQFYAFRPDGTIAFAIGYDFEISDLGVAGHFVYARGQYEVATTDTSARTREEQTAADHRIDDLKRPIVAAGGRGLVISTLGDIDHIPGYTGALVVYDPNGRNPTVVFDHAPRVFAADAEAAYAVVDDRLLKIPLR